jgi:ferredoxin/rubrerythrin
MIKPTSGAYAIDPRTCVRCAACATVAPDNFLVKAGPAKIRRQPETAFEARACEAARVICPTQAISVGEAAVADGPSVPAVAADLYSPVMKVAEGVRWKVEDMPWASFDPAKVTPGLHAIVREMAYSEQTTFSATQRFMEAFGEDPDFSQWISVWFYEETRHPLVLLKWLALAGETPGKDFVMKGRESAPFMKSQAGTLVTNIISEMVAAHAYLQMVGGAPEPLITKLVERIAADEARHGASFFTYARRLIASAAQPERERLEALKVLHFWFNASKSVSHPVNEAMDRLKVLLPAVGAPVFIAPYDRIAKIIGVLTELPIETTADIGPQMMAQTRKVHAAAAPAT